MIVACYPEDSSAPDLLPDHHLCPGLADVAYHGAVDDDAGLLFVGDGNRIKSYSWYDTSSNAYREELHPTHTMDSKGFDSAIGMLPNGRLTRAGRGKVAVWNLGELPTHDTSKKGINGKGIAKREEDINTSRDDPEEIERSSGSLPTATITLNEPRLEIANWHPHPTAPGTMLVTAESSMIEPQYYCRLLDLEHSGKCVTRYLGHAGKINNFSTSKGDGNLFVTACRDGFARLYDVRTPLPAITIQTGIDLRNCSAATLCHPNGIPCTSPPLIFITLWLRWIYRHLRVRGRDGVHHPLGRPCKGPCL
jgi:WD40 repeat protein